MKIFTYNNLTTGRQKETIHAANESEVHKIFGGMGQKVQIVNVWDPDALLGGAKTIPVPGEPPLDDIETPVMSQQPSKIVKSNPVPKNKLERPENCLPSSIQFESDGHSFRIENGKVFKNDWVEVDMSTYKVELIKTQPEQKSDITKDVKIYKKDWVLIKNVS